MDRMARQGGRNDPSEEGVVRADLNGSIIPRAAAAKGWTGPQSTRWAERGVSRRSFLKFCAAMTSVLALPDRYLPRVAEALEGPDLFWRCIFRPRLCEEPNPCSLHKGWVRMREKLRKVTEENTLEHVASRGHARAR